MSINTYLSVKTCFPFLHSVLPHVHFDVLVCVTQTNQLVIIVCLCLLIHNRAELDDDKPSLLASVLLAWHNIFPRMSIPAIFQWKGLRSKGSR